jgi:transposase-like protein
MEITKYCSKCDKTQPIEQFCKTKRSIDGHSWTCKTCVKEYQLANKEKLKAYQKEYQLQYKVEHKEELNAYARNWQKTVGKEKHQANVKRWRDEHPEKVKEYVRISNERAKLKKQNDQ